MMHTVKGFGIVNKAEVDVFLELSCFFDDPADVGNLISGSSALSKSSLNERVAVRDVSQGKDLEKGFKGSVGDHQEEKEECYLYLHTWSKFKVV